MLRHRLKLGSALARLPQMSLLANLSGSSSSSSSSSSSKWPRVAQQGISSTAAAANEAEPDADVPDAPNARQAARELGLDAVPLSKLREMVADALPQDSRGGFDIIRTAAKKKKLTFADLQGYQELLESLVALPESHAKDMPKAPMLDAGQWVDAHFKQEGYGFEPRSPFYVWRAWAAAALPLEQAQTLVAMETVMADDNARSALLKQAQHELARLWDWQHRRAALGLTHDLPHSSSSSTMPDSAAAAATTADAQAKAAAKAAATAAADAEAARAAAAVELQEADLSGSSSSSSSDDEIAAGIAAEDTAEKGMLRLLQTSGALSEASEAEAFEQSLQGSDTAGSSSSSGFAAGSAWLPVEDVVSDSAAEKAAAEAAATERILKRLSSDSSVAATTAKVVQSKLERGQQTADKGRFRRYKNGVVLRTYSPVAHEDDLFLPTRHMGSKEVASQLADPTLTTPVDPAKVLRQAVAIAEAARINAANTAATNPAAAALDTTTTTSSSSSSGAVDGAEWTSMPLLDRGVLRQEQLQKQQERMAAKPKRQLPWQLMQLDNYTFDLRQRPPTPTFDLLTAYLEVKYADVLLRKDAVKTLQRQMAVTALTAGGSATASEVLETPPASSTAAKTLSPAEREGLETVLDDLLSKGRYSQYKEAVLQLYCDGLVSWGEMQQCWAAAQAGEEMTAAEKAPVSFADDRQQLFALLSGQQQLGSLARLTGSSSSSDAAASKVSAADEAAARQAWEAAGKKLQGSWAAAAAEAHSSSSSSRGGKPSQDVWSEPVSYEEAQQTWQQLLQLAGMPQGPQLEQVLLAGSSSSSSSTDAVQQEQLQAQLQQLQQALQEVTGLRADVAAAGIDDFEQLQQLFAAPPSLEEALKQHWEQVSHEQLGGKKLNGPTWQQLWQLLQALTAKQQQPQGAVGAAAAAGQTAAAMDATALFDQYLREAEAVPLTPPPYPGARRLLRWEQRMVLGPTSGQVVTSAETKVKLSVSAAELQQETHLSNAGLQHMLAVAGSRYDPSTGTLSLVCDRFPTREENRRWCLEVLHRLLQEGQARHPSKTFLLGPKGGAAAQQAAATAALL